MEQKINFTLQWSATILTIAGAIFTSLNMYPQNVVAFNLGGVLWLLYAFRINHKSLIMTNAGLLLIYILGLLKAVA
jgi:uncharacterized protein with PQ loop repeat